MFVFPYVNPMPPLPAAGRTEVSVSYSVEFCNLFPIILLFILLFLKNSIPGLMFFPAAGNTTGRKAVKFCKRFIVNPGFFTATAHWNS